MPNSLPEKPFLSLAVANEIMAAALEEAARNNWAVAVAIVNDGGQLISFQRMDHVANASVEVALAKARHAINFRRPTKFHQERLGEGHTVVLNLPGSMPLEGGLPLQAGGAYLGAIGVSGAQSPQDGVIAAAAAAALERWLST